MSFGANGYQECNETAPAGNGIDTRGTAGIPGKDDDRKLFVGGLTPQTTEKELRDYFGNYGGIESVMVNVGQPRGFAIIVFSDSKSIEKVLSPDHYINKEKVDTRPVIKKGQHGKVFVGGLTPAITDEGIRNHFSQYGTIVEIQTPFDKLKNQRKGFCFVTFDNINVLYQVLKSPKQYIKGKEVDVKTVRLNPEGVALNPNAIMGRPNNIHGWGVKPPFPGGYPPQCPAPYAPPAYSNYGEYGPPHGNDYPGYGYPNVHPNQPFGAPHSNDYPSYGYPNVHTNQPFGAPHGNDYPSYGYPKVDPNQPFGAKPTGPACLFHQPY